MFISKEEVQVIRNDISSLGDKILRINRHMDEVDCNLRFVFKNMDSEYSSLKIAEAMGLLMDHLGLEFVRSPARVEFRKKGKE